ncbi:MAG TPA: hypothetical protein DEV81_06240 [Cyanobacteria bacterium UBA11049]|nr:hypothetical protein [Cyanobacteria bacterium UBA11049]
MNQRSLEKIRSATPFLLWFHCSVPQETQQVIRHYLDEPYQLALKLIECCSDSQPFTIKEIAQKASLHTGTVRQVLNALRSGGMLFALSPTKSWQLAKLSEQGAIQGKLEDDVAQVLQATK